MYILEIEMETESMNFIYFIYIYKKYINIYKNVPNIYVFLIQIEVVWHWSIEFH